MIGACARPPVAMVPDNAIENVKAVRRERKAVASKSNTTRSAKTQQRRRRSRPQEMEPRTLSLATLVRAASTNGRDGPIVA